MDTFALNRVDEAHRGEAWQFCVEGHHADLIGPDGQTVASYTPEKAFSDVDVVRFAKSGHNIGINIEGDAHHFTAWPKAWKGIKAFQELSSHASSSENINDLRRNGLIALLLGGALFLGGTILSLDGLLHVFGVGGGGELLIFYGAIVIGAVFLYKSYYYYAEARRLLNRGP